MTEVNFFTLLNDSDYEIDENTGEFIIKIPVIQTDDEIVIDIPWKITSNCNTIIKSKMFKITSEIMHISSINFEETVCIDGTQDLSISNCTFKCDGSLIAALVIFDCENALINNVSISDSETQGLLISNSVIIADNLSIHHNTGNLLNCQKGSFLTLTKSNLHHSQYNAISLTDHSRIEISECQFSDSDNSLFYCDESFCSISRSTFKNCKMSGICLYSTSDFLIENNEFSNLERGISINENSCGTISKNTIHDTKIHGILCTDGSDVLIKNNAIYDSKFPAIFVSLKSAASIQSNKINNIQSNGISVRYAQHVEMEGNEIDGVQANGISSSNSNFVYIHNNKISNCQVAAVEAYNGSKMKVEDNTITNIGKYAFKSIVCATIQAKNNKIDSIKETMAKLFFKGSGEFIDNKITNCSNQFECETTGYYFFKGNGNFPAVSNDLSRIDDSIIRDDLLIEENCLCMKCKQNKRCCYLNNCGHKVFCKECAEKALNEKDSCPICTLPVSGISAGIGINDDDEGMCCICYENKADCLIFPCGHIVACLSCLSNWFKNKKICPFCRNDESNYVQIFDF